jgi:hypothetical protein
LCGSVSVLCGKESELVRHHDHFGDLCWRIIFEFQGTLSKKEW